MPGTAGHNFAFVILCLSHEVGDSQRPPCDRKERCHRHQPVLGLPGQVAGALPPPLPQACSHFLYWSSPRRPGRGVSCSSGQPSQSQVLLRWNRECLVTGEPQARAMGQRPRFLQSQCPERKDVRAGWAPLLGPGHLVVRLRPGCCGEGEEWGPREGVDFTKPRTMSL